MDNPSAHKPPALYEVFAPELVREVLRRLEFHFLPRHASWFNMVEFEIGVLVKQCLDRRIADPDTLRRELASWQRRRNAEGAGSSACSTFNVLAKSSAGSTQRRSPMNSLMPPEAVKTSVQRY